MVVAAFSLDILGLLSNLCSRSAYPYQQNVPGTFPRIADHPYGPRPWLADEAFILGTTPWAVMIKTNFFICYHGLS